MDIDSQIKSLLRKKAKIAMLETITNYLAGMQENSEHDGLKNEVKVLVEDFLAAQISAITNGAAPAVTPTNVEPQAHSEPAPEVTQVANANKEELRNFIKKYGGFGFKNVTAKSVEGAAVKGKVMKQEFPYLVVNDELSGNLVQVDPETVKLV